MFSKTSWSHESTTISLSPSLSLSRSLSLKFRRRSRSLPPRWTKKVGRLVQVEFPIMKQSNASTKALSWCIRFPLAWCHTRDYPGHNRCLPVIDRNDANPKYWYLQIGVFLRDPRKGLAGKRRRSIAVFVSAYSFGTVHRSTAPERCSAGYIFIANLEFGNGLWSVLTSRAVVEVRGLSMVVWY